MRRLILWRCIGLLVGLIAMLSGAIPAQAQDPLGVVLRSHSGGLSPGPEDCTDALRALTAGLVSRPAITHIVPLGGDALERVPARIIPFPVAAIMLAHVLQGPQNEVAIIVCAVNVKR